MPEKTSMRVLPAWAEDLRRRYVRGEASMFVLHGNVFDAVVQDGLRSLPDFLTDVMLSETKDTIVAYNVATGGRFAKRAPGVETDEDLTAAGAKDKALAALERLLVAGNRTAVVLEYADAIAPAGDPAFQADTDRAAVVTLHRWSFLPAIEKSDNLVILITENLTDLSAKLVANPRVAVVRVPMPDLDARRAVARLADPQLSDVDVARYAAVTAGLKAIQIFSILAPPAPALESRAEREKFVARLLGDGPDAAQRAHTLAALTAALPREEVEKLVAPGKGVATAATDSAESVHEKADQLIAGRKREILERECFGLVEFVEPVHGFEVVGGMEEVKSELKAVAENIRAGRVSRVPMGILFTGPMGTGKTFVAEAFAKECGLTTIKLKNFRSKWVGATEGNLEKILGVIQAIGQVVVIIDEGDRAFGGSDGEGDGGTSSRVIARIKEFMSDTSNRGRILFLLMTNRPDKLDSDIKRAGRLDRKIPFLYSQTAAEVEAVLGAQLRKNSIKSSVDFSSTRAQFSEKLVGYSNADVEAVVLVANELAARDAGAAAPGVDTPGVDAPGVDAPVEIRHFLAALEDYFPNRDSELLEYMELLAVFEASSRRLLPPKYATMTPEEMDARLRLLRATVANRR
jgi:transitional endoplasmic reticulum ATPase